MENSIKINCKSCGGTGLYIGMAERNGAAAVCSTCSGTGYTDFNYTPFTKKETRKDVKRVFEGSFGYVHSSENIITHDGRTLYFSDAGVSYDDWLQGKEPKPVKELYCPYIWTSQDLQKENHPKHNLYKNFCGKFLNLGGSITSCQQYNNKKECWKIYGE